MEVCCGEYGDFNDRMIECLEQEQDHYSKGCIEEIPLNDDSDDIQTHPFKSSKLYDYESSMWLQFKILLLRTWTQMWRDRVRYKNDLNKCYNNLRLIQITLIKV